MYYPVKKSSGGLSVLSGIEWRRHTLVFVLATAWAAPMPNSTHLNAPKTVGFFVFLRAHKKGEGP